MEGVDQLGPPLVRPGNHRYGTERQGADRVQTSRRKLQPRPHTSGAGPGHTLGHILVTPLRPGTDR